MIMTSERVCYITFPIAKDATLSVLPLQDKRLDFPLKALLRLLRFKTFDRLLKREGYKSNEHIGDIRKNHTLGGSIKIDEV